MLGLLITATNGILPHENLLMWLGGVEATLKGYFYRSIAHIGVNLYVTKMFWRDRCNGDDSFWFRGVSWKSKILYPIIIKLFWGLAIAIDHLLVMDLSKGCCHRWYKSQVSALGLNGLSHMWMFLENYLLSCLGVKRRLKRIQCKSMHIDNLLFDDVMSILTWLLWGSRDLHGNTMILWLFNYYKMFNIVCDWQHIASSLKQIQCNDGDRE